jgi:glutaredoxin-like YruB-family protein
LPHKGCALRLKILFYLFWQNTRAKKIYYGTRVDMKIYIYLHMFTDMKQIHSFQDLSAEIKTNRSAWLLLMKSGSEQSECALKNLSEAVQKSVGQTFMWADVSHVRDIHPRYDVNSVPALLEFRDEALSNIFKGCHQPEQFHSIFENAIFVPESNTAGKPLRSVTVYTTPTCSWCTTLKRHLDQYGVKYREVDVSKDIRAAEAMVRKSGQQGVPQTEINGQMIVGFDRERINKLLEIK